MIFYMISSTILIYANPFLLNSQLHQTHRQDTLSARSMVHGVAGK